MKLKNMLLLIIAFSEPQTGYTLYKKITMPFRPSPPQVYHILRELKNEGLVDYYNEEGVGSGKHLYILTEKGRLALQRWFNTQDDTMPMSDVLTWKLWSASLTEKKNIIAYLETFCDIRKHEIRYYTRERNWLMDKPHAFGLKNRTSILYATLALDFLIFRGKNELEFIENAVRQIMLDNDVDI